LSELRPSREDMQTVVKYLNPSLLDFIEQLQSFEYIPEISKVADLMDFHTSTIWKFMKLLKQRGLAFQGLIDMHKLGVDEIILVFDEYIELKSMFKGLMREYAPILPWGTYVKYLVPKGFAEAFLNELYSRLGVEPLEVYIPTFTIYGKPDVKRFYDMNSRRFVINWDELYKMVEIAPREIIPKEAVKKSKFDELDLLILRVLETSPFESIKNVVRILNEEFKALKPYSYVLVLRHYNNHIEARGVIKGVRLRSEKLILEPSLKVMITANGNPLEMLRFLKVLTTHPYFHDAYVNTADNVAVTFATLPVELAHDLSIFMDKLKRVGIIRYWKITYLDIRRFRRYALPVKMFSENINNLFTLSDDELLVRELT